MKICWASDIHFDHCDKAAISCFVDEADASHGDVLLIAGDITSRGLAPSVIRYLERELGIPVYFVLGNHDFYGTSISEVRTSIDPELNYLTHQDVIRLSADHALIGHDGWADGRAGDFMNSNIMLNDYIHIEDLKELSPRERLAKLQKLSKESLDDLSTKLHKALNQYTHILLVTHVPPFHECALHNSRIADDSWAPHFVNLSLGGMLKKVMENYPKQTLTVICGHTHSQAEFHPLPNLFVLVGGAEYGHPKLQEPIFID